MKKWLNETVLFRSGPFLAAFLIRLLRRLMRIEFIGEEAIREIWDRGEHPIMVCWHDQLLLMAEGYLGRGVKVLISASKDGELIARTLAHFGYETVRGSSSRGGGKALLELVRLAREPYDLAITPDGPRGPRRRVKEGVVHLARLTGRPIVPVSFVCSRGHRFSSWDRFLLPYPFSRGVFAYGKPVYFMRKENPEDFRKRVQESMDFNDQQACMRLEGYGVSAV